MNINQSLELFFTWILRTSWQSSVVIAFVLLAQWVFRKQLSPRWRYALWFLVLARMVMPSVPESPTSVFNVEPDWVAARPVAEPVIVSAEPVMVSAEPVMVSAEPTTIPVLTEPVEVSATQTVEVGSSLPDLHVVLALAWFVVVLLLGLRLALGSYRLSARVGRQRALTDQALLELLEDCKEEVGIQMPISIVESPAVKSPALLGFLRPRLLLPEKMSTVFGPDELRHVFRHELAHLKRGDVQINWLISALQVLHWFNPIVWVAFHRMRADREAACDAFVLNHSRQNTGKEYGETVIKMLEFSARRSWLPGVVGILEDRSQLKTRIKLIAAFGRHSYRWSALAMVLFAVLGVLTLTDAQTIDAEFPHELKYELGVANFQDGDAILIDEVRGTRPDISVGGTYVVKGRYTLGSMDEGTLLLSTTVVDEPGDRRVDPSARKRVSKGSGAFELVKTQKQKGYLHISFYHPTDGNKVGGVYFGVGDSVLRKAPPLERGVDTSDSLEAELNSRNLDFEEGMAASSSYPSTWGGGGSGYEIIADKEVVHGGRWSGRIKSTGEGKFASLTGSLSPSVFAGKRIRYSGYMKLQEVDGYAGLWMRADVKNRPSEFYNMHDRKIVGTVDWTHFSFELEIPHATHNINFGALLSGNGTLWVDDLKIEVVGEAVEVDQSDRVSYRNLNFEQGAGPGGNPRMWGGGGTGYEIIADKEVVHGGKWSGRIKSTGEGDFATLTGSLTPSVFAGKRIRYSGYMKLEAVTKYVGLWFRADVNGRPTSFNNMQGRQVRGTRGWQKYAFEIDVPLNTDNINFGALLAGEGTLWVDDLQIEVVGVNKNLENAKNHVIFGNPVLDEVSLIGLDKEEALKRLGRPGKILSPEKGLQTYEYPEAHRMAVVFRQGKVVMYVLKKTSAAKTVLGIGMGSSLSDVTDKYGKYTREEEVSRWFAGSVPRVLYYHKNGYYKINYPKKDVIFKFDSRKNVVSIWVGYIFPVEREE